MYEDEIDLRYYVRLLLRSWPWIVAAALLAAVAALGLGMARPKVYEATAAAAIVRSRTDISLDARIQTLEDYQLGGGRLIEDRLAALRALADSNEVMRSTLDDVGALLAPEARTMRALRSLITVEQAGDMISFSARHEDPEVAAAVANSVTRAYVARVNQIYGASDANVETIAAQVETARQRYDAAQTALQDYLADERQSSLSLTLERELAIKRALLTSYQDSRVAIETSDASASSELLTNLYTELKQIETWLADAETLRDQVSAGGGSYASRLGDTLALLMLRARVYGGDGPLELQMDLANAEIEDIRPADVDNLIAALEARRASTRERIQALTETLGSDEPGVVLGSGEALTGRIELLTREIIDLESQLESELATREADRRELEATRDRAWEAYQALTNQLVEAEIQADSSNTEVRVADTALTPEFPVGSGAMMNSILAAIVAVMLAVGAILLRDWWSAGDAVDSPREEEALPPRAPARDESGRVQPQPEVHPGD
jgi:uncharacterized protein involved in exopolysaccharide biosynthesis